MSIIIIKDNILFFLLRFNEVLIMYSMNDMTPITNVQGPIAGPIDQSIIRLMRTYNIPVMYKYGLKYIQNSDVQISISWDIHR